MKKQQYSKMLLNYIFVFIVIFIFANMFIFYKTGNEQSTLIVSVFSFVGTEVLSLLTIKVKKIKKGGNEDE